MSIPTPPNEQNVKPGKFFAEFNRFSFSYTGSLTKAKEHSLLCHLPIAGGRIIGFIP